MSDLGGRIDDVDIQIERISRLIDSGAKIDRELAAGLGCDESLGSVQSKIDRASVACEDLDKAVRALKKPRR